MLIPIKLPEEIEKQLETAWGDLSRRTLKALILENYRSRDLSAGQVAEMLRLSIWETEELLKDREAYLHYTFEDGLQDREAMRRILSR